MRIHHGYTVRGHASRRRSASERERALGRRHRCSPSRLPTQHRPSRTDRARYNSSFDVRATIATVLALLLTTMTIDDVDLGQRNHGEETDHDSLRGPSRRARGAVTERSVRFSRALSTLRYILLFSLFHALHLSL